MNILHPLFVRELVQCFRASNTHTPSKRKIQQQQLNLDIGKCLSNSNARKRIWKIFQSWIAVQKCHHVTIRWHQTWPLLPWIYAHLQPLLKLHISQRYYPGNSTLIKGLIYFMHFKILFSSSIYINQSIRVTYLSLCIGQKQTYLKAKL